MGGTRWLSAVATGWALCGACGGSATSGSDVGDAGADAPVPPRCAPNEIVDCRGPLGCNGVRRCLADRSAFGPCACVGAGGTSGGGGGSGGFAAGGSAGTISVDGGPGSGGVAGGGCAAVSMLLENRFRPVQVVWAIDNSASMSEEVPVVQAGLNAFAQAISAASIDLRLVTISDGSFCVPPPLGSGNCPNDSNPPAFRAVDVAVTGGAALNQILQLFPQYAAGLAAGSQTYVGVVSDSDSSMSATEFSSRLAALDPMFEGWKFAGIYCPSTCTGSSACTAAGGVYRALVSATSGLEGNLCAAQTALSSLAARIVANAKLACFWDLPPSPEPLNPSHVNVEYSVADGFRELLPNVQSAADCGDGPGWYYDNPAWPTRFYFCPATCSAVEDAPDLAVSVLLGCATVVRP